MNPLMIGMIAFLAVAGLVGLLAFVFRDTTPQAASRLDMLIGKRRREDDEKADILRKSAFEGDKKNLLETLTPKFLSPQKMFEQADCHIKPHILTGIGLGLAAVGATATVLARMPIWFAPLNGLVLFTLPLLWLWFKRRIAPEQVRIAAVRRAGAGGAGATGRPQPGRGDARGRPGNADADRRRVQPGVRGTEPRHPH